MIDFKQAYADVALLYRAAHQHCTYEDKTHYRELDIQKAQERLSTLLESLEEKTNRYRSPPREIQGPNANPCGEIVLGEWHT